MEQAKKLKEITFIFEDDKKLTLRNKNLQNYVYICLTTSDYLLPRHETDVLANIHGGIVRGFVMKEALKSRYVEAMK